MKLKERLDALVKEKDNLSALYTHPDPLQVASLFKTPVESLVCALFAYGNAKAILKFLKSFDFVLLNLTPAQLEKELKTSRLKYRFQSERDVKEIYKTLACIKQNHDIKALCEETYAKTHDIKEVIISLISLFYSVNPYRSSGYEFFFSHANSSGPFKRYNMFLRWMVRRDALDFGLFSKIDKKDLVMPLDTHTHKQGLALGLMQRKSYDFKAAVELTQALKKFDPNDPVKYDFALYRLGQLNGT